MPRGAVSCNVSQELRQRLCFIERQIVGGGGMERDLRKVIAGM